MKAVPDAMLLASLPQSEEELGGEGGVEALTAIEAKSTQYLIPGWEPVIESEIDGQRSIAGQLDAQKPESCGDRIMWGQTPRKMSK